MKRMMPKQSNQPASTLRLAYHPQGGGTLKTLRLAYNSGPVNQYPGIRLAEAPNPGGANSVEHHVTKGGLGKPAVRQAYGNSPAERNGTSGFEKPPHIRLAHKVNGQGDPALQAPALQAPALLVSFYYLAPFLKSQARYHYRDWALDSGAFSAHNSGSKIDLSEYIKTALALRRSDPTLTEVFSLDVIGDYMASLKNCEQMWAAGVQAIPTYHEGEPWDCLLQMAKDYPKIALGGVAYKRGHAKLDWAKQCFARVWPKPIHGFGFGSPRAVLALPWHSVDATNWEIGPCKYGRWNSFGKMSVRGSNQNLKSEVEFYLNLEQQARVKWRKQMEILATGRACDWPSVRLADVITGRPKPFIK